MPANRDFRDLFAAFNDADVRFIVVGGYATIYHSEPRYTKDLDIWLEPSLHNARRVLKALETFGAPLLDLGIEDLCDPRTIYQIGIEPNRIDLLLDVAGLEFATSYLQAVTSTYAGQPIRLLSLEDLLIAKRRAGRPQDLLDVQKLEQVKSRKAR